MSHATRKKRGRRFSPILLVGAFVAFAALLFLVRKVGAEAPPRELTARHAPFGLRLKAKERLADKEPAAVATGKAEAPSAPAASAPASPTRPNEPAAPAAGGESSRPQADDPAERREREKELGAGEPQGSGVEHKKTGPDYEDPLDYAAVGADGGVPIHPEGRFRSPFAHPRWGKPANIKVGFLLANVRDFDIQKGTFEADFFVSLTSDVAMPPMDMILTNGKADLKEVMADKPTFKAYRFVGTFSSPVELHDYPFDTQELTIELEDDDNGTDQIRLEADEEHTNLDVGFNVPGWETAYTEARVLNHYFPDRFEHDDLYYSRYVFRLGIRRFATSAVFTVFMPAFVIILISLTGLWLPRSELEVRSNATVPMLAAAVLFHFALTQALPATAYLTRADKVMMSVYSVLGLHMVITMMWFFFDEKYEERILQIGKWVGAPVTFLIFAAGCLA